MTVPLRRSGRFSRRAVLDCHERKMPAVLGEMIALLSPAARGA